MSAPKPNKDISSALAARTSSMQALSSYINLFESATIADDREGKERWAEEAKTALERHLDAISIHGSLARRELGL